MVKFGLGLLALILVSAAIYLMSFVTSGVPCYLTYSKMEVEGSWGIMTGCMVKVDGKWAPLDNVRVEPP